jgi:hypothetical protein
MRLMMTTTMSAAIAALQYATAATFLIIGWAAYRHGAAAQRAAEAEVGRQGVPVEILSRHYVRFEESAVELLLPLAIALVLGVIATLNLVAPDPGRTATWIFQPLLLVAGGFVTANQVFAKRLIEAQFRKSSDPDARRVDAGAVIAAAAATFPSWLQPLVVTRFVLVTVGSALILLLLAFG